MNMEEWKKDYRIRCDKYYFTVKTADPAPYSMYLEYGSSRPEFICTIPVPWYKRAWRWIKGLFKKKKKQTGGGFLLPPLYRNCRSGLIPILPKAKEAKKMECQLAEICKFYTLGLDGETNCNNACPRKPKKQFVYANEIEVGLAVIKDWRKIGDKIKPESFARNCAACIYNIEKSHPYRTLTCKKTNGVTCLFRNICENRDGKTGNQIADECQGLLNTLVLCPGHNCGFVTRERETNRTCGGNYRCEKCSTIYDSSLWTAHWKPIEPAKKFEPFEFTVCVPDKGRLFQLAARLSYADKTITKTRGTIWGTSLEKKHSFYDQYGSDYDRLLMEAKKMGLIK